MSRTTLAGGALALLTTSQVDVTKLFDGDKHEIVKLVVAFLVWYLGYYAADRPKSAPGDLEDKRETKGVVPGVDPLAK